MILFVRLRIYPGHAQEQAAASSTTCVHPSLQPLCVLSSSFPLMSFQYRNARRREMCSPTQPPNHPTQTNPTQPAPPFHL
jgi:hypothetical protein